MLNKKKIKEDYKSLNVFMWKNIIMDRVGFLTCLSVFKNACQVLEYKFYLW